MKKALIVTVIALALIVALAAFAPTQMWSGGYESWAGGYESWAGGYGSWAGGLGAWSGGYGTWAGAIVWGD